MTQEKHKKEENPTVEKLESVGQIIIGEIEKIGGILTADPVSQAEGELTGEAGSLHLETAENMEESESQKKKTTE